MPILSHDYKTRLYQHCRYLVEQKIKEANNTMATQLESTANEDKSSAGDKHETGRAMAQLEQEKTAAQLMELEKLSTQLERLVLPENPCTIGAGCIVKITGMYLFLSIPLGKVQYEGFAMMVLSPVSPIGKLLMGKKVSEKIPLNGRESVIEGVI